MQCPKCGKSGRGMAMHIKHCKVAGFHPEVEEMLGIKVISDSLKVRDTGDAESDMIWMLENNELDELRRNGITIPEWRLNSNKYSMHKLKPINVVINKFLG